MNWKRRIAIGIPVGAVGEAILQYATNSHNLGYIGLAAGVGALAAYAGPHLYRGVKRPPLPQAGQPNFYVGSDRFFNQIEDPANPLDRDMRNNYIRNAEIRFAYFFMRAPQIFGQAGQQNPERYARILEDLYLLAHRRGDRRFRNRGINAIYKAPIRISHEISDPALRVMEKYNPLNPPAPQGGGHGGQPAPQAGGGSRLGGLYRALFVNRYSLIGPMSVEK